MSESGSEEKKTSKAPAVIAALLIVLGVGGVALSTFSTVDETRVKIGVVAWVVN